MNDQILPPEGQPQAPDKYYEALVGDGKKFKDNESLARSKWESDSYIKTLEAKLDNATADNKALREANTSQASMQELLDLMKQQRVQSDTPKAQTPQDNTPKFDPATLPDLVAARVKELDQQKLEKSNMDLVQSKIKEKWGSDVPASVRAQIENLGELGVNLAKKYPDEFLRTIGAQVEGRQQTDFFSPPRSGLNASTLKPEGNKERTWSYYEDMRKTKPDLYYSKKMSVQMHNDAIRLGDQFMDGDFDMNDQDFLRTKYKS